jgi:hypothetical protein
MVVIGDELGFLGELLLVLIDHWLCVSVGSLLLRAVCLYCKARALPGRQ